MAKSANSERTEPGGSSAMRKRRGGTASGEINVELRKLMAILVLSDAMVLSRCRNLSGTETILSYVKLTFKST